MRNKNIMFIIFPGHTTTSKHFTTLGSSKKEHHLANNSSTKSNFIPELKN